MKPNWILTLAAVTALTLGASYSIAGDRAPKCIELSPGVAAPVAAPDAGGFSLSTGDHLTGEAAYLAVHVETPEGRAHPAFGVQPQGMYLFITYDGRYVVRFMGERPGTD
jgi:hypothetical protein